MDPTNIPVLVVTGGAGFIGQAVMRELLCNNTEISIGEIRVLDLAESPGWDDSRIRYFRGDIRDEALLSNVMNGADAVLHLAAMVDWGTHTREEVFSVNVEGTEKVMRTAKAAGVRALVFTSSLDAVCSGKPIINGDESIAYPKRFPNAYCESKASGEQLVREYAAGGFNVVSLRPSGVYGEADPYHISALINMAEKGPYARIGNGKALCQHVYVGNVAHAHLIALKALWKGNQEINGNAYFLTDSPPKNFFGFLDPIVEGSGYQIRPKNMWIPKPLMWIVGVIAEGAAFLIRPFKEINPKLSRFAVNYTCNDFTLSGDRARRDFGFVPKYNEEEAFDRTVKYFRVNGPVKREEQ